jgi:hypothetical protein
MNMIINDNSLINPTIITRRAAAEGWSINTLRKALQKKREQAIQRAVEDATKGTTFTEENSPFKMDNIHMQNYLLSLSAYGGGYTYSGDSAYADMVDLEVPDMVDLEVPAFPVRCKFRRLAMRSLYERTTRSK